MLKNYRITQSGFTYTVQLEEDTARALGAVEVKEGNRAPTAERADGDAKPRGGRRKADP